MFFGEELFRAFALFINGEWNFFFATLAIIAILSYWKRREKSRLEHMLAIMLISFVLALALKQVLAQPRPCMLGENSLVPCPNDFGLPSLHTTVVFALVVATIGLQAFPFYFLWGVLVALSRIYLGVHSVPEVGAGIALAVFALAIVERFSLAPPILLSKGEKNLYMAGRAPDEFSRKIVQMLLGLAVFAFGSAFGASQAVLPVLYLFCCGLLLFHMKSHNVLVPPVDGLLAWLERPRAPAGYGALTFFAGILISLCLIPQPGMALSAVFVLAVSDSAATFAGTYGTHHLPYNRKKTIEGSCAFFISALPVYFIGGPAALLMAALAAIIESLPIGLDDNLLIPWAGVLLAALKI